MMMAMMTHGLREVLDLRSGAGIGTLLSVTPRPCAIRAMIRVTPACSPAAVFAARKVRHHVVAAHLAGKAVGDELLEVVADLDPDVSVLHRQQHEQPVVFALGADAAPAVLEHLHRVFAYVGVRRERLDRRHHDDIARRVLQLENPPLDLGFALPHR